MMKKFCCLFFLASLLLTWQAWGKSLKAGPWRFVQKVGYGNIPFIIDFQYNGDQLVGTLFNGKEKIVLDHIKYDKKSGRLMIPLQTYENSLELEVSDKNTLTGHHIRLNKDPQIKSQVFAIHGDSTRFAKIEKMSDPTVDLNGRWEVTLVEEDDKKFPGIIVFEQKGKNLNGSILTSTGDYRYFEGYITGNTFETASYDGVYNYLFRGAINEKVLTASILSNSVTTVTGTSKPGANLPDPYAQTKLPSLDFKFPDVTGKVVSLTDAKFAKKAVVVQLFGSWCPNCMDEMNYLIPWYKKNRKRGVEVVSLAFERSLSRKEAIHQLEKLIDKKKVPYTLLVAGHTAEDKPIDKIAGLNNFISFPTTIFLNKKHQVVKVHAGFTGPSTGDFYRQWKKEFNQTVDQLLK